MSICPAIGSPGPELVAGLALTLVPMVAASAPPPAGEGMPETEWLLGAPGQSTVRRRGPRTPPPRSSGRPRGRAVSAAHPSSTPAGSVLGVELQHRRGAGATVRQEWHRVRAVGEPHRFYQGSPWGVGTSRPTWPQAWSDARRDDLTGFERTQASSRVFFQLSSDVPYEVSSQGNLISLRLPNTSPSVRNNIRRLDTRYFRTLSPRSRRRSGQTWSSASHCGVRRHPRWR